MLYLYLYSIVQIILESMPVSSSGHVLLLELLANKLGLVHAASFFAYSRNPLFNYFLHIPTCILIAVFFFREWYDPWRSLLRYAYAYVRNGNTNIVRLNALWRMARQIILFVVVADICTIILWWYVIPSVYHLFSVGAGFLLTASVVGMSKKLDTQNSFMSHKSKQLCNAGFLGLAQGIALLPGVSRLGVTYVMARFLGYSARRACHISFLIQWPLLVVSGMRSIFLLEKMPFLFSYHYAIVIFLSSCVAYGTLYFFYWAAIRHKIWYFGVYEIIPACAWFILAR